MKKVSLKFCKSWNLAKIIKNREKFLKHKLSCVACQKAHEILMKEIGRCIEELKKIIETSGGNGDPPGSVGGSDF